MLAVVVTCSIYDPLPKCEPDGKQCNSTFSIIAKSKVDWAMVTNTGYFFAELLS